MSERPRVFIGEGRFEIVYDESGPTAYAEETHEMIQVCIPLDDARYRVTRRSETGRLLVHDLAARDVLVLPVGQPHAVTWHRQAGIVSLQMTETFIEEALDAPRLKLSDSFTVRDPFIIAAALQLRDVLQADGGVSPAFGEALAVAIAYRVGVDAAESRMRVVERVKELDGTQVSRIDRFIEERLDQALTLGELAALVGLTRWHFVRRFQASTGCSPHEYITRRRVERAQKLLGSTELSISEIALEVGVSHSHLSRTFAQRLGVSPSEYRRIRRS